MSRGWTARRFDTIEVAVVVIFTVVLTAATTAYLVRSLEAKELERISYVAYTAMQEGVPLADRYGPARYSRNEEEWIIRDYFRDKPGGVFVDVGANHYKNDSNTFYLESVLRWSGVAIDPQPSFAAEYRAHRPRTRYFSFFVSDSSDATVKLFEVNQNSLVASADKAFAERAGTNAKDPIYTARAVSVPTIRLTDLLDRARFSRFDLLQHRRRVGRTQGAGRVRHRPFQALARVHRGPPAGQAADSRLLRGAPVSGLGTVPAGRPPEPLLLADHAGRSRSCNICRHR